MQFFVPLLCCAAALKPRVKRSRRARCADSWAVLSARDGDDAACVYYRPPGAARVRCGSIGARSAATLRSLQSPLLSHALTFRSLRMLSHRRPAPRRRAAAAKVRAAAMRVALGHPEAARSTTRTTSQRPQLQQQKPQQLRRRVVPFHHLTLRPPETLLLLLLRASLSHLLSGRLRRPASRMTCARI